MDATKQPEHSHIGGETVSEAEKHGAHKAVRYLLIALLACAVLPVFGVGLYTNSSGDRLFSLPYLLVFMGIAFFLMHEVITPLPPSRVSNREDPQGEGGEPGH
jgi:hypothetical protein